MGNGFRGLVCTILSRELECQPQRELQLASYVVRRRGNFGCRRLHLGCLSPCTLKTLNASMLNRRLVRSVIGKALKSDASAVQLKGPLRTVFE